MDFKNNVNNDINNDINLNGLKGNENKITKKNLENFLNYLNKTIEKNIQMKKNLEIKIERLSKQN